MTQQPTRPHSWLEPIYYLGKGEDGYVLADAKTVQKLEHLSDVELRRRLVELGPPVYVVRVVELHDKKRNIVEIRRYK